MPVVVSVGHGSMLFGRYPVGVSHCFKEIHCQDISEGSLFKYLQGPMLEGTRDLNRFLCSMVPFMPIEEVLRLTVFKGERDWIVAMTSIDISRRNRSEKTHHRSMVPISTWSAGQPELLHHLLVTPDVAQSILLIVADCIIVLVIFTQPIGHLFSLDLNHSRPSAMAKSVLIEKVVGARNDHLESGRWLDSGRSSVVEHVGRVSSGNGDGCRVRVVTITGWGVGLS